ncbi:GMC family oxidoreductase [Actinocorallia longicatena]|uniref:Cholesterol oxidase n=1 Tax=Actinocorallia longicatena TaxID=111803 RepID=A0ABP6QEI0_9ACTN
MEHVQAVVIGSGFGGSVAAFRLADAGLSTVLLERGQAYAPGQFPRTPAEMGRAFWDPRKSLYGMYDVWRFDGYDSVVSSGLGGGSLIYANVLLRKDEKWFVHEQALPGGGYEHWPVKRADLDPHYDDVERFIGVSPYPVEFEPFGGTAKTHAMQDAAAELGLDWFRPPLAVSFGTQTGAVPGLREQLAPLAYPNLHGAARTTCRLCGECDIGCNDGAKNSLDHTYLSAAKHRGADLRTLHEAKRVRVREGGGYLVDYVRYDPDTGHRESGTIGCDKLVMGAGTYGTVRLLLASGLPGMSPALGSRFCGNGDLLTFLLKAKDRDRIRPLDASKGPVITSAIRLPDELDGSSTGRGAYIQDGGYPGFVDWMLFGLDVPGQLARTAEFLWERFADFFSAAPDTNLSEEVADLIGSGALSVSSLPLLAMGRDVPDGVLSLDRDGNLCADWTVATSKDYFDRIRGTMQKMADVLGARYHDNPLWFRKRVISVHPLGGAPMGRHPGEGVCDAYGEVFGLPGLYIADGAALPGPVGANPSLTIAALADRMCTSILTGTKAAHPTGPAGDADPEQATGTGAGPAVGTAGPTGGEGSGSARAPKERGKGGTSLSFTEEMKGHHVPGACDPHDEDRGAKLAFRLTITADDVTRFLAEPGHLAGAEGWIEAPDFGGRRRVERGWFNLFVPVSREGVLEPDRREMRYRLFFSDVQGRPLTLSGWKDIHHGPATHIWPDTTTLYYRIFDGHLAEDAEESVVGAGTLHIRLVDFVEQLTTFRTEGPDGLGALNRFGRFFLGELWDVYGPAGD